MQTKLIYAVTTQESVPVGLGLGGGGSRLLRGSWYSGFCAFARFQMRWFNCRRYKIRDRTKTEEHTLAGCRVGFTDLAEMAE